MSSCPAPLTLVGADPLLQDYLIATAVIYPFFLLACFVVFYFNRNSSVYLRKRPLRPLFVALAGNLAPWFAFSLYDVIGAELVPCGVFKWLTYSAYVLVITPTIIKLAQYRNERSTRVLTDIVSQMDKNTDLYREFGVSMLKGEASWRTTQAHLRMTFCPSRSSARQRRTKILNAKFCNSNAFVPLWFGFTASPFILGFIIIVSANPATVCVGCELDVVDLGFFLSISPLVLLVGVGTIKSQTVNNDPLQIIRECVGVWMLSATSVVGWILLLTDPGNLQADNVFRWRNFLLYSCGMTAYYQTVHQVIISRSFKFRQRMLASTTFNNEDRFLDIMSNKRTKQALKRHLTSELSTEILDFIDAVTKYKHDFAGGDSGAAAAASMELLPGQMAAAASIADEFIRRGSPKEVNLSSKIRDTTVSRVQLLGGTSSLSPLLVFDDAYEAVKSSFLVDGFPRFLHYLQNNESAALSSPASSPVPANLRLIAGLGELTVYPSSTPPSPSMMRGLSSSSPPPPALQV